MRASCWFILGITMLTAACVEPSTEKKNSRSVDENGMCIDCEESSADASVVVGTPSGDLAEGGSLVTIPIKLARQPDSDVELFLVSLQPTQVEIEPAQMTFTSDTWGTTQILKLSAVDDDLPEADQEVSIELSLVSEDDTFGGRSVEPVTLMLSDNDGGVPDNNRSDGAIVVSTSGSATSEAGDTVEVTVQLSAQPAADVFAPVAVDDETEAEVDTSLLTFTALNWNTPQRITVRGVDDLEADGDQLYDLTIGPTNSTDEAFSGVAKISVELGNFDGNCGNGVVDGAEACEPDGSSTPTCAYGDMSCTYCADSCETMPGEGGGWCGDGLVQSEHESCEGPTQPCAYGEQSCTTCDACETVAGQVVGYCGDGVVQGPEECDGGQNCTTACKLETPTDSAKCLMISEYVEGTFYNKAIEIYNCEGAPVALERYEVCMARDADSGCSRWYDMQGTMQAGETLVICNQNASTDLFVYCDVFENHVTEFNGDDRLFVYHDENGDGKYDAGDTVVDAFGEIAQKPPTFEWVDTSLSRCNLSPYSGTGAWSTLDYFEEHSTCSSALGCSYPDAFTGLGVAPTAGCP